MNESNLKLTSLQTKAVKYLASRDARTAEQMLHMVLNEGFEWTFNHVTERTAPYLGFTDDWQEIEKELQIEFKKTFGGE
tara:strand:- start:984 stop:1220 length:237 start_codon:yes stop_codon:yes gene_type:complete